MNAIKGPVVFLWSLSVVVWSFSLPAHAERLSFNQNWLFTKDDPTNSEGKLDYQTLKPFLLPMGGEFTTSSSPPSPPEGNPGEDVACTRPDFNDSSWRKLNLPHDWGIEGPFKIEYPGETGKLPWWGVGWYRKHFNVPAGDKGKCFYLDVDGAMSYSAVWLNGRFVGGWPYGYASWRLDLTPYTKTGAENVLAIRLDNPSNSSRWYPGGGIYRNVWLVKTEPVHFTHWGTFITTPEITKARAVVQVSVRVENDSASEAAVELHARIDDSAAGRPMPLSIPPHSNVLASLTLDVKDPKLWDVAHPHLYNLSLGLTDTNRATLDGETIPLGIRTIQFTADNGFLLNGKRVPIQGVCDHHDLGALGSALNLSALERQLRILQEMGCNAIRTSHNPPAPELLDLCDRMGFLVMDEAFDCWARGKTRNDYQKLYPDWHEKDLRALIRRDRNHPCVILWSIGNEVREQGSSAGPKIAAELRDIVHSEDRTRPVTSAASDYNAAFNGYQKQMDVFGYNYKPQHYGKVHDTNAGLAIFGSETASCISSRGEYFFPINTNKLQGQGNFQVSSYDLSAPQWAWPPDVEFRGLDEFLYVAGEFVWTGFDYLGEPTPYNKDLSNLLNFTNPAEQARMKQELDQLGKIRTPSRSSYFGIIDLAGFKKDRFYIYQARWKPDLPMAHILPHWDWPDRLGKITPVHVYTSGDEGELFLNGKSQGRKKKGQYEYRLRWDDVVYQPGTLKVVAYKNGKRWATDTMRTARPAAQIRLTAEEPRVKANGQDLAFITAAITDESGNLVPRLKNRILFTIAGPGEIVATDNGDATSLEPFQSRERDAFNGLALAIVRPTGQPGTITLRASSESLSGGEIKIRSR
jgi:beta-galactosidase